MAFNESFWVATSAAAPVIALAAIVALPEAAANASIASYRFHSTRFHYIFRRPDNNERADLRVVRRLLWRTQLIRWATFVNLLAQASLLAVSLSALANDQNPMPSLAAIVLAAGGILLLAWSTTAAGSLRRYQEQADGSND